MADQTLTGTLKRVASDYPSRRALFVAGKLEITYSHLDYLVDFAASRLVEAGILPGYVVALTFPNTVEVRIIFPVRPNSSILFLLLW
ncbi:4-coumarate--CoA ligase-like 10 [Platanthera guangdongensis]|uniref:4-coumarate--CoA ligase-like 10 n=1 Tax=Platanthera guangdongensis TaxID=2320717 RepID=A0ABR2MIZ3_9ASPA